MFHRFLFLVCLCALMPVRAFAFDYALGPLALNFSGYIEGLGVYALNDETPSEKPSLLASLTTQSDFGAWGGFKLTLKGLHDGKVKDPANDSHVYEFDKIYQDKNPALIIDEAYFDIYTGKVDFRIGIQKFAWGRLDEINPTDNLNTEDVTSPLLNAEVERKIGVPAVKTNIYSDLVNCEIAWIPRYVPYRLPLMDERWFPPILRAPESIDSGTVMGEIPVVAQYDDIELPSLNIRNSEAGIRFMKSIANWELSASYFTGYDPLPMAGLPSELLVVLDEPFSLHPAVASYIRIQPELHRMHVFGLDFSTTFEGFTIRGEGAYMRGKRYFRTSDSLLHEVVTDERQEEILNQFQDEFLANGTTRQAFVIDTPFQLKKDAFKGGLGVDYLKGDSTFSVQIIHEYVFNFENSKPIYLIKKGIDTSVTAAYKTFLLQNTLEITLAGVYDIPFRAWLLQPAVTYSLTDSIKGTLGCIVLDGPYEDSLLGQYRKNDEVFCKLRYSF